VVLGGYMIATSMSDTTSIYVQWPILRYDRSPKMSHDNEPSLKNVRQLEVLLVLSSM
jgi:hypothetical protein